MAYTSYGKTKDSPTVYGTTDTGQNVAFENEQQFLSSGGDWNKVGTLGAAPTGAINFSQYSQVNTSQPSPQTTQASTQPGAPTFYKPETPVQGFSPETVFNSKGEGLDMAAYLAQGGAKDFSNVQKVTNLQQGLTAAKAAGVKPPQDAAAAKAMVDKYTPKSAFSNQPVDLQLAEDPGYQQLLENQKMFNDVVTQRQSLAQEYQSMVKQAGIEQINMDLLNAKNVLEGTEQDLRTEVTKAGGFASESQIQSMKVARNKTLVKNYQNLLDTKQMAMETINTMIGLSAQDRDYALQAINQKMNLDAQIIQYRDNMQQKATDQYRFMVEQIGFDGLLAQTGGDPYYVSLVEKTLGLGEGGLQAVVTQQQEQKRLENYANYNIFSRFVNAGGQIEDTQTGYAFTDPDDFMQRTGMSLQEAEQGGMVTPLGLTKDEEERQWDRSMDLEQLNLSQQQLDVSRGNLAVSRYNASKADKRDTQVVEDKAGNKVLIDSQTGEVISNIGGSGSQAGPLQIAQVKSNIDQIQNVLSDSTLNSAVGATRLNRFTVRGQASKNNFLANVQQITSQLTMDSLINAKAQGATFGALSEGELKLLEAAASKLNTWAIKDKSGNVTGYSVDPATFKRELDRINNFAQLDYVLKGGNPADVGIQMMPDGSFVYRNSDGSYKEFEELAPLGLMYP